MKNNAEISLSILLSDVEKIKDNLIKIERSRINYLHLDIMDGNFVENTSFDFDFCKKIKLMTDKKIDTHLMVQDVDTYFERFIQISDIITFHYETLSLNLMDILLKAKEMNCKIGIAIKPSTKFIEFKHLLEFFDLVLIMTVEPGKGGQLFMDDQIKKIEEVYYFIKKNNLKTKIQIDGGVNDFYFNKLKQFVDIFVIGSYLLNKEFGFREDNLNKLI